MPLVNPVPVFDFTVFLFNARPFGSGGAAGVALGIGSLAVELAKPFLTGSFSEVSGLNSDMETHEYREGGRNAGPHKFIKWGKFDNLVFRRGVTFDTEIWDWYSQALSSPQPPLRKNGLILLTDRGTGVSQTFRGTPEGVGVVQQGTSTQQFHVSSPSGGPTSLGLPVVDRLPIAAWYFENGLPEKCHGPGLNAKSNELAIEVLEISHERILRLGPGMIPGIGEAVATLGL